MARSTGDGTDEGPAPQPSAAPTPPPESPAAAPESRHAAPDQSAEVRLRVTGPAFTDAVEVEVEGQRLTVTTGGTSVPAALADAVIAQAGYLDVTVEKED
jgi:hypothetical protein